MGSLETFTYSENNSTSITRVEGVWQDDKIV
jgi:hypothetical protein